MMAVLLLRLSGPLQSWGDASRFNRRLTRHEPTKSGIVGMLAAAQGRSREDSLDDLAQLEFAVRIDQPGELLRDFQTEIPEQGKPLPLSHRYYLSDAKFLVALGGSDSMLEKLEQSLKSPVWPLYLGRRSCPPDLPIVLGLDKGSNDVRLVLEHAPWQASEEYKRNHRRSKLEMVCDGRDGERCESRADVPVSFSLTGRTYACRPVYRMYVDNPDNGPDQPQSLPEHDPMAFL